MSTETMSEAERTRTELAATLGVLQDKLNVPRKMKDAATEARLRVRMMRDNKPALLAGLVAGGVVAGAAALLGVRMLIRR